jgi:predicted PurR-regulated permease PerM
VFPTVTPRRGRRSGALPNACRPADERPRSYLPTAEDLPVPAREPAQSAPRTHARRRSTPAEDGRGDAPTGGVTALSVWIVLINTLALLASLFLLWKLRLLVSWVLVALFIALALQPAVSWLTRHRVRRGWAVLVVILTLFGVVGVMLATVIPMLVDQGRELVTRAPDLIERLQQSGPVRWIDQRFQVLEKLQEAIRSGTGNVTQPALAAARGLLLGVTGTITVVVIAIFMLLFGDEVLRKGLVWVPPGRRQHWVDLSGRMQRVVGGYVAGTLVVAAVGGMVMGTTLAVLGVPYFVPLGLLMIVLGIIPFVGSAIGAVLCVGTTFAEVGFQPALICAGVYLVYQQVENQVLQPVVQKRTLKMNPLIIMLALLAGTGVAGILGTLLALPVAGAIQVLLQDALERRRDGFGDTAEPDVDT